jgi:TP901 family phage tail tape measure protein
MASRRSSVIKVLISGDSKGLNDSLEDSQSKLARFGTNVLKATAAVGTALAGLGVAAVREFAKFDAAMTKSTAIMGDVSDTLREEMSDAAREVARVTTFSAEQAAESYFFLASAGLDAEASIAAMPKVAAFAQAGMFDMALATDLLTDAQSALGMVIKEDAVANMEQMVRLSDVLVKANTLANASVEQFSSALTNKAGAALRAINKDVEEGVAVLAAFADQGIKGEAAGTQLSIVLRDLSTRALKNADDFAAVGFSVFDSTGKMRNLGDIVANLEDVLAGMSDETQKATLLQMGFSDKSLASLTALLGTSEAIKTYEAALREANGTTEEIADNQLQTFSAQLGLLRDNLMDVGIEIGGALVPSLMSIVGWLQENGPGLRTWAEETATRITTFVADVKTKVEEFKGYFDTNIKGPVDDAREAFTKFFDRVETRLGTVAAGFAPFKDALGKAFDPQALQYDAGAADDIATGLEELFKAAFRALRVLSDELGQLFSDLIGDVDWFEVGKSIMSQLGVLGLGIATAFLNLDWLGPVFTAIKENFVEILFAALTIALAPASVVGKLSALLAKIPLVGRFLSWITTSLNNLGGPMRERITLLFEGFVQGWRTAINNLGPGIISRFVTFLRGIPASITSFFDDIAIKGAEVMARFGEGIRTGIGNLLRRLYNLMVRPLVNWARTGFDDFIRDMRFIGENLMTSLRSGILAKVRAVINSVRNAVSDAVNAAKNFLGISSPSKVFLEIGSDVADGFALGIERGAAEMRSAIGMLSGASINELTSSVRSTSTPMAAASVVNVTVTSADPEAVVEAIRRYTRRNGPLGGAVTI